VGGAREDRKTHEFGWKTERKDPFKRTVHGWQDNIKLDLKDTEWEAMEWINLAQDSEISASTKCREFID
jgi:hypothetical protein